MSSILEGEFDVATTPAAPSPTTTIVPRGVEVSAGNKCGHGLAKGRGTADVGIAILGIEGLGDERDGRLAPNRPV